jgi:hypothetical protein
MITLSGAHCILRITYGYQLGTQYNYLHNQKA